MRVQYYQSWPEQDRIISIDQWEDSIISIEIDQWEDRIIIIDQHTCPLWYLANLM